jgi:hypothetical protein
LNLVLVIDRLNLFQDYISEKMSDHYFLQSLIALDEDTLNNLFYTELTANELDKLLEQTGHFTKKKNANVDYDSELEADEGSRIYTPSNQSSFWNPLKTVRDCFSGLTNKLFTSDEEESSKDSKSLLP